MAETGEVLKDDLLDAIYQGEIAPLLEARARNKFKPWHKPRKHFVRLEQWCHETRKLLKVLKTAEGGELRYLGLPGEDLLDIRVLHGVCERAKLVLRYLGFDSSLDSPQLNLSRHEVNSAKFMHPSSVVISDRLGDLASQETVAFRYVEQHAPFDIINLDLCDSVTATATGGTIPNLEAIRTLCDVQLRRRGQPWLLFLTTRAIRDSLDGPTRESLFKKLLENMAAEGSFSSELGKLLGIDEAQIRAELSPGGTMDADSWLRSYILAIGKWLLHYMAAHEYSVSVRMVQSYTYSVVRGQRDMASLGFLFEPPPITREDETGLTKARSKPPERTPTEQELASQLVQAVADIEDIDDKLAADKKLLHKMFSKSATIMATLRYDMQQYKSFALDE